MDKNVQGMWKAKIIEVVQEHGGEVEGEKKVNR